MQVEPTTFFIVLTNKCNLHCKHCYDFKTGLDMTSEMLDLTINYIINKINTSTINTEFSINFVGGEIGFYNQSKILEVIDTIKEQCKKKKVSFGYQSNFVYKLTDEHLNILKEIDEVGTSYDYKIRFSKPEDYIQWIDNLKILQSLNKPIRLTTVLTKQTVQELNPDILLDFVVALNIHCLEINVCYPKIGEQAISNNIQVTNETIRDWYYSLFRSYIKLKKVYGLSILNLDCVIDSFNNEYYWEHGRQCSLDNETISPNGNVSTCLLTQYKPLFNLKTNQMFNKKEDVYKQELNLNKECTVCKYLKYCKGGCQCALFDKTGCPVPYKIYDYLNLVKNND